MQAMRNKTWEQRRVTTPMRKLIIKLPGMFKPLSPKSNQHQISPCNLYQCFVKQSGHENYGHDHTR